MHWRGEKASASGGTRNEENKLRSELSGVLLIVRTMIQPTAEVERGGQVQVVSLHKINWRVPCRIRLQVWWWGYSDCSRGGYDEDGGGGSGGGLMVAIVLIEMACVCVRVWGSGCSGRGYDEDSASGGGDSFDGNGAVVVVVVAVMIRMVAVVVV